MRSSDVDILFAPGFGGAGPGHWMTRWGAKLSTGRKIEQADWDRPMRRPWVESVADAVAAATRPVVLVGQGLGALAIAHAAEHFSDGEVKGAFLVAPPMERALAEQDAIDPALAATPRSPLPFPAVIVASRSDPNADYADSEMVAQNWGARLLDAGDAGGIDEASGHGPWPEGLMSFAGFLRGL